MAKTHDIAIVIGSLRKDSLTRKVALVLKDLAPAELKLEIVEIGRLELYNQDFDANPPASWVTFRDHIRNVAGVLFVTPEYNRSIPAPLKNAVDVGSRPYGQSVWNGKPAGIVSVSPGAIGGFGANHHLRQSLVFLNMPTLQQPEVYVGGADKLFDESGALVSDNTRKFLEKFMDAFSGWVAAHAKD